MINKILVAIIILLSISTAYFYWKSVENNTLGSNAYDQEQKCFSWSVYNPELGAWRWRTESLNEYFPTREDAVSNCIVLLNGTLN